MGDTADIGSYQFQLEQVQEALSKDPQNDSLLLLEKDLKELISALELVQQQQPAASTSSQPKPKKQVDKETAEPVVLPSFVKGERVLAKYGDGKYYEATVDSISDKQPIQYNITYTQYNTSATVPPTHLKPFQPPQPKKKKAIDPDRLAMMQEKRKRVKMEEKEHQGKQKAWQDFAKKTNITRNKKSLYDRPETGAPTVTSATGKKMTTFVQRGKHKFEKDES